MPTRAEPVQTIAPTPPAHPATPRWLLFVHQFPARPSNPRVRTWRRLQQLGAIAVKQAVYVLPDSADAREDFEWLKTAIEDAGGEVSVFAAGGIDAWSADGLVQAFRRARQEACMRRSPVRSMACNWPMPMSTSSSPTAWCCSTRCIAQRSGRRDRRARAASPPRQTHVASGVAAGEDPHDDTGGDG